MSCFSVISAKKANKKIYCLLVIPFFLLPQSYNNGGHFKTIQDHFYNNKRSMSRKFVYLQGIRNELNLEGISENWGKIISKKPYN